MKALQFSDAQKAFILKQGADGVPVAEICRKAGISQATYFNWKKKYDGLLPPEMRRLKQLEEENAKLKRIVADLTLDREVVALGAPAGEQDLRRPGAQGLGEPCVARLPGEEVHGVAEGLEADGALRLRLDDGSIRRITAGDVFFGGA